MTRTSKVAIFALAFICCAAALGAQSEMRPVKSSHLTFNKDIAPIIFQNCVECHHAGGPAPFGLSSYQDVKKRAGQIAEATTSRYMPPWLPEPGYGEFVGERRLTDEQVKKIRLWAEQGAVEGDGAPPAAPKFTEGWQLGQPDLIVKLERPYQLRAEGPDVFRNFVIPVPVTATRYVKAVEILPGNKKVVHHANILIDRSGSSRLRDEQDAEIGFEGMEIEIESESFEPDSHFLFWKPGSPPATEPPDMAWRLEKGTDLVLNMHLQPSGKPELIQPEIGLYFTDQPPARFPMLLQLEHDGAIDIKPGEKNFIVTDELELPVDVDALGVYPHAHYLGKELQGFAALPGGERKQLIRIKDWDINWQAVYRFAKPVFLPKGTKLFMRYAYDNSADNARNPNNPPRRVTAGNRSSDEMGHLWIQVLPRTREDSRLLLQEAMMRRRLQKYPSDFTARFNLAAALDASGKTEEAITNFREALRLKPDSAMAWNNLGAALQSSGNFKEAIPCYKEAVRLKPDYGNAHYNLANSLLALDQIEEAIFHLRETLRLQPDDANACNSMGSALAMKEDAAQAMIYFERAIKLDPNHADACFNLGRMFALQNDFKKAAAWFERAIGISPQNADAHNELGKALAAQGDFSGARTHFERALLIEPGHAEAKENLRRLRLRQ